MKTNYDYLTKTETKKQSTNSVLFVFIKLGFNVGAVFNRIPVGVSLTQKYIHRWRRQYLSFMFILKSCTG